jgi:hypothetical protein
MQKPARSKGAKNTLTPCVFPHLCIHKIILSFYFLEKKINQGAFMNQGKIEKEIRFLKIYAVVTTLIAAAMQKFETLKNNFVSANKEL